MKSCYLHILVLMFCYHFAGIEFHYWRQCRPGQKIKFSSVCKNGFAIVVEAKYSLYVVNNTEITASLQQKQRRSILRMKCCVYMQIRTGYVYIAKGPVTADALLFLAITLLSRGFRVVFWQVTWFPDLYKLDFQQKSSTFIQACCSTNVLGQGFDNYAGTFI